MPEISGTKDPLPNLSSTCSFVFFEVIHLFGKTFTKSCEDWYTLQLRLVSESAASPWSHCHWAALAWARDALNASPPSLVFYLNILPEDAMSVALPQSV